MKCIIVLALVACAWAAPQEAAKEPASALQPLQLSEFIQNAQKNINDLASSIKTQLNLPDQETVVKTIKEQSETLVNNVQSYINTASEEVKNKTPELEKVWADVQSKLKKVVDDLNSSVPNAKESAEQLQKKFQEGVQTVVKETNAIAESLKENSGQVKETIAQLTKNAVDATVEVTQNLNEQLKKAASQAAAAAAEKKN